MKADLLTKYWNTLRYLKPVQVHGRLWFKLHSPQVDARPAPALRAAGGAWASPAEKPPSMLGPQTFRFLNQTHDLTCAEEWNAPERGKLWLYNLHYFDDLCAEGASERAAWHKPLMHRWIDQNPAPHGNGWEPYPTSLRIVNWVKWSCAGHALSDAANRSLATQVRWLHKRLERHLLANHLFVNAKALVLAGLYFQGPEADRWLKEGLRILSVQMPEQILPDGGHFERSPMYHALILEDVLDMINAATAWPGVVADAVVESWRHAAAGMLAWLEGMSHPDGDISFFNDAALGIAPTAAMLRKYAARLKVAGPEPGQPHSGILEFRASGYIRAVRGSAVLLADVAPVAPDYQPGHAHADTLSFEFSLHGSRVLVNSGTSTYAAGQQRTQERGTAAHNTVQLDDCDSSEMWGAFRVARRARPFGVECRETAEELTITASHDGYRRLPGRPVHQREWRLTNNALRITDRISGAFSKATAHFHLAPGVQCAAPGELLLAGGQKVRYFASGGALRVEPAQWHSEFGRSVPNQRIVLVFSGREAVVEFSWS